MQSEAWKNWTDTEYEAALAEIEILMETRATEAEGDRLDYLVSQVKPYEARYYPFPPVEGEQVERPGGAAGGALRG